jgi:hypothetical protein
MSSPMVPGPGESSGLSPWEREILAGIERDLEAESPRLAREMAQLTAAAPVPPGVVETGFLVVSFVLVLAVAGLVPAVVWAFLAVISCVVVVPWVLLRVLEKLDPPSSDDR